ncbi:class I SAM-dependent methyltransferase [Clostridium sp. UBA4548]|uniref:class I SAM-dependent methyltransferase n=1 Tax=Clostridium sp. UBA4548 TaxID=1946361 RepID=UPI0025C1E47F|nr:class I SAM-dependent methyltransferase [Clostridium sp. UBA4548]
MGDVISFYDRYDEDNRLVLDSSRKIEFHVTTTVLNQYISKGHKILELGAGTGAYSFYYGERGNTVVATDLTPKHVDIIEEKIKARNSKLDILTAVVDATDLSRYESETFDVVTCLGPMYHLTNEEQRIKCIEESLRSLKPGGTLAIAYINKHYIVHVVMAYQREYFSSTFVEEILSKGYCKEGGDQCFYTVGFFTTPTEMEEFMGRFNVDIIDHVATDGISSLLRNSINELSDENYKLWNDYSVTMSREKSLLGISNHGLLICRKK